MSSEVTKLIKAMNKATIVPKKNKKKGRRNKNKNKNAATSGTYGITSNVAQGQITFSRLEYVSAVKSGKVVALHPDSLPFLKNLATNFELCKWLYVEILYKPSVGTTTAGSITVGIDWSNKVAEADVTKSKAASLTPMMDMPVWQSGKMVLPVSKLQTRKQFVIEASDVNDKQPCQLVFYSGATGETGDLWINYKVQLYGTK